MEMPLFVETWSLWVVSWLSGLKLNLLTAKWYSFKQNTTDAIMVKKAR